MALLTPEDLENQLKKLQKTDETIKKATGMDLKGICESTYGNKIGDEKIGIIPITAGNGIIGSFSESLLTIVKYLGVNGFITQGTDVTGYHEVIENDTDILLMSDDWLFIAHNLKNGKMSTNPICTGVIYAEIASRSINADSKDILVLGLGRVGYAGAEHLMKKGFNVFGYDPNRELLDKAVEELGIETFDPENPKRFNMIFEATPEGNTISEDMVAEKCLVSTPGIPCGLPDNIKEKYDVDLVWEPLGIGVAAMIYSIV